MITFEQLVYYNNILNYHNILNEHKGNSKKAWEVINELAFDKKKTGIPPTKLITTLGDTITDQQSIAEEFNKYFC